MVARQLGKDLVLKKDIEEFKAKSDMMWLKFLKEWTVEKQNRRKAKIITGIQEIKNSNLKCAFE